MILRTANEKEELPNEISKYRNCYYSKRFLCKVLTCIFFTFSLKDIKKRLLTSYVCFLYVMKT